MTLILYEWRKLLHLPALWGFLALCLAFNGLLLWENDSIRPFFNESSELTADLGQRVDGAWIEALERRPWTEYQDALLSSAREMTNLFADLDLEPLSQFYQRTVERDPRAVRIMAWKYRLLAGRAAHLGETGAAMDLYAGPVTHDAHQFLYNTLLRSVLTESAILAMLSVLYLLGYERQRRTELLTCASRTGRGLYRRKVLAGVAAAGFLYALLAAVTLGAYFLLWDYGGVWSASVSSQSNYLTDMLVRRPFLTWADFTAAGYLAAVLALGAALTALFALLAAFWGLLLRNTYLAALALAVLCFGGVALVSALAQAGLWTAYFLALVQPSCVWLSIPGWFTELSLSAAIPWQETASAVLNLMVLGLGTALALRYFGRKDLVT